MKKPLFSLMQLPVFCSFQDQGRKKATIQGFSRSGAMDQWSYQVANRLCGGSNLVALEIAQGGLKLSALTQGQLALTGANAPLYINQKRQDNWCLLDFNQGDIIEIQQPHSGCWSYLCVPGGFVNQRFLQSGSCHMYEPQHQNNHLDINTTLFSTSQPKQINQSLAYAYRPLCKQKLYVRFIPAYQWDSLAIDDQQKITQQPFTVSSQSNRMGYRLTNKISLKIKKPAYPLPIIAGSIQIPNPKEAIIMMRDHQTLGGYPQIGTIIQQDLNDLAQLRAGGELYLLPFQFNQQQHKVSPPKLLHCKQIKNK